MSSPIFNREPKPAQSRHEQYRSKLLSHLRSLEIVFVEEFVAAVGQLQIASRSSKVVDLIFCRREEDFASPEDFAFRLMRLLRSTPDEIVVELLTRIALQHPWRTAHQVRGLNFEIYPSVWFHIPEPLAGETIRIVNQRAA